MRHPRSPIPVALSGVLALGWVLLVVGCAQPRPYADLWVPARPYHGDGRVQPVRPPTDVLQSDWADTSQADTENPTGVITLHDAVALALGQHPALSAAGWGVVAAEADARQQGRPPNPRVGWSFVNFAGPDAGAVFEQQTLRLSQVIELGDKRAKRQALGEATQRLRAWDYEAKRVDVAADTAARYVTLVVSQQQVALARLQRELADAGFEIADDRVRNGTSPGLVRDQAAARQALGRIALDQALQQLDADRAALAAAWGGDTARFEQALGDLERRVVLPDSTVLQQRLAQAPAVARWEDEIAQRERAVALARAQAIADPSAGVGVRYFPDADDIAGLVELSVPLNVLDDNRHAVLAARLRVAQARSQAEQARVDAAQQLAQAHARMRSATMTLQAMDAQALPAARSAYDAAREAFESGLTDYLSVLDTERTLLDIRRQRLDATLRYHLAAIAIERLTGQALQEDNASPAP